MLKLKERKKAKKTRLFIALKLDKKSEKGILELIEKLGEQFKGKFCKKDKLHLTLVFLGWVSEDKLEIIQNILKERAKDFTAFSLQTEILELCRKGKARNHLWLRFQNDLDLRLLESFQKELEKELRKEKLELEERKFLPHLTLARQLKIRAKIKEGKKLDLKFNQLVLYRSILTRAGSRYRKILSFKS